MNTQTGAGSLSDESPFPSWLVAGSLWLGLQGVEEKDCGLISPSVGLWPLQEGSLSCPNHPSKAPPPSTITLRVRLQLMTLGRTPAFRAQQVICARGGGGFVDRISHLGRYRADALVNH